MEHVSQRTKATKSFYLLESSKESNDDVSSIAQHPYLVFTTRVTYFIKTTSHVWFEGVKKTIPKHCWSAVTTDTICYRLCASIGNGRTNGEQDAWTHWTKLTFGWGGCLGKQNVDLLNESAISCHCSSNKRIAWQRPSTRLDKLPLFRYFAAVGQTWECIPWYYSTIVLLVDPKSSPSC